MGGAIRASRFCPGATEMELGRARITDRPFAGMLGQVQHAGPLLGAENWLWDNFFFQIADAVVAVLTASPR